MVLNETKKELRYSKNLTLTSKYIILYSGTSVVIYDYKFACQKKISNLKYVYNGYVSPDETKLLLVSNTNRYYLFSLENFSMLSAHSLKSPYNANLEGVACWCTNDSFLLPAQNSISLLSTLKKFNCDSPNSFKDYLAEAFWIKYITVVEQKNKCLIIGFNRRDNTWNVIWMDMDGKHTVYRILDFDEAVLAVDICYDAKRIVLTGESKIYSCDFYGVPSNIRGTYTFENIIVNGFPLFFKYSQSDASIAYLGTTQELIVYDLKKHVAVKQHQMEFGARDIKEFGEILFVSTYNGLKLITLRE